MSKTDRLAFMADRHGVNGSAAQLLEGVSDGSAGGITTSSCQSPWASQERSTILHDLERKRPWRMWLGERSDIQSKREVGDADVQRLAVRCGDHSYARDTTWFMLAFVTSAIAKRVMAGDPWQEKFKDRPGRFKLGRFFQEA